MRLASLMFDFNVQELALLTGLQKCLHERFAKGCGCTYMMREFDVFPGVFPPRHDSMALVRSMKIEKGQRVLDVCCGSGVIGLFALARGAGQVVGLDISPAAVSCARLNAKKQRRVQRKYEARESDCLSALQPGELFDVVVFNPPYRDLPAKNLIERTMWDPNLAVHRAFFSGIGAHLAPGGKIYFAQANFGPLREVDKILQQNGWTANLLDREKLPDMKGIEFFAFEATKKS